MPKYVAVVFTLLALIGCGSACAESLPPPTPTFTPMTFTPTKTPTATATPNMEATVEARVQATIEAMPTDTPTASPTPTPTTTPVPTSTPTPTSTPNIEAALQAAIQAIPAATLTPIVTPSPTPTLSPTTLTLTEQGHSQNVDWYIQSAKDAESIAQNFNELVHRFTTEHNRDTGESSEAWLARLRAFGRDFRARVVQPINALVTYLSNPPFDPPTEIIAARGEMTSAYAHWDAWVDDMIDTARLRLGIEAWKRGAGLLVSQETLEAVSAVPTPAPTSASVADLVERTRKSVVRIQTRYGAGSGFVASPAGHILTNEHVIRGSTQIIVTFDDGTQMIPLVLDVYPWQDIAVLKVTSRGVMDHLILTWDVEQGEEVVALGYPLQSVEALADRMSVTKGIVSSLRDIDGTQYVQTDAALNKGNSGGPLINLRGEVVGMITRGINSAEGITFAVGAHALASALVAQGTPD